MTAPPAAPSAHGQLSTQCLGELLAFALERRLGGSFVFESPEGAKSALYLRAGRVTKARTAQPVETLGRLLLDSSLINPAALERGLFLASQTRRRLGEALLELKALTPGTLEATLREQLARRVSWLGRLPSSSAYGFFAAQDLLGESPACEADPLALIWRSLRSSERAPPQQAALLASLGGRKLRLHTTAAPERLGLSREEEIVVNALRTRPRALEELLQAALLDGERVQRLMYALALTRQLDQAHPGSSLPPSSSTSGSRSGRRVEAAPSSQRPAEPALLAKAQAAFEAAHAHLQRKQFGLAEIVAKQACEADTGNAEYLALHAWLRAQQGELSDPSQASQIVAALDRAVLKQPSSARIRFYRGQVLKRLGREEEAFRDFRFVLRREPGHLDATREVRLYQMRKQSAAKKPGIFSKLFLR